MPMVIFTYALAQICKRIRCIIYHLHFGQQLCQGNSIGSSSANRRIFCRRRKNSACKRQPFVIWGAEEGLVAGKAYECGWSKNEEKRILSFGTDVSRSATSCWGTFTIKKLSKRDWRTFWESRFNLKKDPRFMTNLLVKLFN
jgi:hypothetical protein